MQIGMRFLNRWIFGENREKKNDSEFLLSELPTKKYDIKNSMDSKNILIDSL